MNKLLATLVLLITSFSTLAQAGEATTLMGNGSISHGFFGAVESKLTTVDGHNRAMLGAKGAWIINHGLYVGVGGYHMSHGFEAGLDENDEKQYLQMGYGGLLLGYTFFSDRLFHLGVEGLLGGGYYALIEDKYPWLADDNYHDDYYDEHHHHHEDCDCSGYEDIKGNGFILLEPQLVGEVNVSRFMRVAIGVGYRVVVMPEEKDGFTNENLSGPSASLTLKFGKF